MPESVTSIKPFWRQAAILLAVALATRLLTLGNPLLHVDEEFYLAVGRAMHAGALPFVDVWDRKPIGLFLLYAIPGALPWQAGVWAYQLLALACAAGTAILIARLAARAGWASGGTLAGAAYLAWITIAGGQGGQSPVFYNLAMAAAALLIVDGGADLRRAAAAMLLVGLAIQVKYTAALEGVFFGCWLLFCAWRRGERWPVVLGKGALLVGLALAPTLLAFAAYAWLDQVPAFVFANFTSIFARKSDPGDAQLTYLLRSGAMLLPLVALTVAGARRAERTRPQLFLIGWLAAALVAFALVPPWADHYTLPVMLPAAVLAAGWFATPRGRKLGLALILIAALVGQASIIGDRKKRGTPTEFDALVAAVGRGPGCLYVYSASAMLYPATGRCAVSRYVFPSHLTHRRERGAIGVDQAAELSHILARRPAVIVAASPYSAEQPAIRARFLALVARDYRLTEQLPLGRRTVAIYRRKPGLAPVPGPVVRFD